MPAAHAPAHRAPIIVASVIFLFFSGFYRGNTGAIALSLLTALLYGSMAWGVLPTDPGISWESHLSGALTGLILAYVALNVPFTIWLIDGFFRQVPKDLAEAAQIDGCTRWQAFWQVEFPLAGPGIASAGIFAFLTWRLWPFFTGMVR